MAESLFIFRFLKALRENRSMAGLTGPEKGFLLAFLSYIDGEGVAFPSALAISEAMGSQERQAQRARASLREKGILEAVEAGGGRAHLAIYRLRILPETPAQDDTLLIPETPAQCATLSKQTPAQGDAKPRRRETLNPGALRHPNKPENKPENKPVCNSSELPPPASKNESKEIALFDNGTPNNATPKRPAPLPAKLRPRDEIWEAVAAIWFGGKVAAPDQSRVGKLVRGFKAHGATPQEIQTRLARYRREWSKAEASGEALLKWWARFGGVNGSTIAPELELKFAQHSTGLKSHQFTPAEAEQYRKWKEQKEAAR